MNMRVAFILTAILVGVESSPVQAQTPIQWRYRPSINGANPIYEEVVTNQGFHLDNYARWRYGNTADAYTVANNHNGWRISYSANGKKHTIQIDWLDVAYYHGVTRFGYSRLNNWGVYRVNNSSSGWKGAYVVRIR